MWSSAGLERLRVAVQARLRAVLEPGLDLGLSPGLGPGLGLGPDCPPLEPRVRTVLEQRLDSAALDLLELIRRGEDTVPVPAENVKTEPPQVKQEPETPDLNIVCVKVEPEEQEIQFRPDPEPGPETRSGPESLDQAEPLLYCPQCGSSLLVPPEPPDDDLPSRPRCCCCFCGRSLSRDLLLLEHSYTRDGARGRMERRAGFRCSVCARDFGQVGALLEHMSQHLSLGGPAGLEFDSGGAWSFEDDAFDGGAAETICSICGDVFTECEQLQEHLRSHLR